MNNEMSAGHDVWHVMTVLQDTVDCCSELLVWVQLTFQERVNCRPMPLCDSTSDRASRRRSDENRPSTTLCGIV